ncbi:MAG: PAS domain-containing protein, partial [Rhodomicrobium sp.]
MTIAARITAIAVTLAVPLNLVIFAVIWRLSEAASEAQRTSLLYTARSVAAAVDAKLGEYVALAQALARSPHLLEDNLDVFDAEARRAFASPDARVAAADFEGQQLINTARQPGQRLPLLSPLGLAAQKRAFETHTMVIAGVQIGTVSQDWIIHIEVPIFKDAQPFRALAVAVKAQSFFHLLNAQHIPKDWLICILDHQGRFVARVPGFERNVGQLAPQGFLKAKDQDGLFEFLSVEGEPIVVGNAHSEASGWPVAVAVKKAEMQAATWNAIRWATMLGGGFSILSLLLTGAIARSITRPISELRQKSGALLAEPAPAMPPPGPPEVRDLWRALKQSAADRYHSDQKLRLALTAAELGTWRLETRTREIQWDERSKALFGLPPDARVSYKNWANAILPEDKVRAEADVVRALDPDEPHDETACEFRVRHPDGTVRWLSSIGRAFFEPDPQSCSGRRAVFISGAMRDVTEVHMAGATLRASEERFRGVFENAATGIAILDLDGRFQSCNPAFSAVLGYSEEELRQFSFSKIVHPEDRDANASQAQRLLSQQIPSFEIVMRYLRKDGKPSWVQKYVSLLRDATGKPTHILGLVTDIT